MPSLKDYPFIYFVQIKSNFGADIISLIIYCNSLMLTANRNEF